jgi:cytochrome c5
MMRTRALAVALALAGCISARAGATGQEPPPAELANAPGKDVVVAVCGECHDAAPKITRLRKSRVEWADLVTDMQSRGLMADEKDLQVVLDYLTANYGPAPAAK